MAGFCRFGILLFFWAVLFDLVVLVLCVTFRVWMVLVIRVFLVLWLVSVV